MQNQRVFHIELESLRGAAAFSVMMLHIILVCLYWGVGDNPVTAYQQLPGDVFAVTQAGIALFNGRSAVTLFFVLSAFVLSANITRADLTPVSYAEFVTRRLFRIIPALWVALAFALIVLPQQRGLMDLVKVFALLDVSVIPVTWTLVLELAACLVFPLMLVAVRQMGMVAQLCALLLICWIMRYAPPPVHYGQVFYDLPLNAFYLGLIVPTIGRALVVALPLAIARVLLAIALLIYATPDLLRTLAALKPDLIANPGLLIEVYVMKIALPLASWYVVAWVLYGEHRLGSAILNSRPLRFLGRTSYSLYVLHPPLLALFAAHLGAHAVGPYSRLGLGMATVIPITLVLSALSYTYVERPGIAAGKRLIAWTRGATTAFVGRARLAGGETPEPSQ
ncbi:acyltransferase [Bradyrhizobium sp.]|uniref:acyltransferase family protein n=1 Tax=Bradyrhizobium sp. TaxID=376 RepID=UPI001EB66678|nr:acyltransferase [Bradyrhizobium sp.]MBV9984799.1 acyltransferase [Bradyrhizobium sp.]